ncbi:hypothetical protein [Candidatus Gromoviella agglomerans]|uniref:hypothetical protein n=1 Tax=Candidatus Gromoviella agglomerans TaxID=2806609 RepID=UPI001E34DB4E|nr:hypothetical protein [Candidatus Gromoviella agglomerans]UFX98477.1 hypothetical protein Gromo_00385 [Candidatus Gromoviella agglomerans]
MRKLFQRTKILVLFIIVSVGCFTLSSCTPILIGSAISSGSDFVYQNAISNQKRLLNKKSLNGFVISKLKYGVKFLDSNVDMHEAILSFSGNVMKIEGYIALNDLKILLKACDSVKEIKRVIIKDPSSLIKIDSTRDVTIDEMKSIYLMTEEQALKYQIIISNNIVIVFYDCPNTHELHVLQIIKKLFNPNDVVFLRSVKLFVC